VLLGIAGLALLLLQLRIMGRQTDAMNRSNDACREQTVLQTANGGE